MSAAEDVSAIARTLAEAGSESWTQEQIATHSGVSRSTVSRYIQRVRRGATRSRNSSTCRKLTAGIRKECRELHIAGLTQQQVADRVGISLSTVRRCLQCKNTPTV